MTENIFAKALKEREIDQESIKAAIDLEVSQRSETIHLSLPAGCKNKFLNYCEKNYITPSAALRIWINQNCD